MKIYKKLTTLLIIIVVLLLSATPVLSPLLPARANPDWTKDANPVFVRGYLATAPFVLYDGGTYKMWYTQQSATLTTFDNLLNNIRALGITSLVNHLKSHSFSAVASGDSVTVKAIINYLATHASEVQNLLSSMNSAIGYTTSADGNTWQFQSTVLPVTSGQWDKFYVGTPSIIKNSSTNYEMWYTGASVDASAVNQFLTDLNQLSSDNVSILLQDIVNNNVSAFVTHARHARPSGDSYLFTLITDIIGIINNTNFAIGRATSTDGGLSWNKYGTAAVLPKGSGTDWDRHGVGAPSVIKDSSGTYHMWYTGFGIDYGTLVTGLLSATDITAIQNTILAAATMAIGHATSPDGIIWTRDGSNPVLPNGASTDWDSYGVGTPSVLRDSSGNYQMWYTGAKLVPSTLVSFITGSSPFDTTLTSGVNVAIGHATSSSGVGASWTKDASYVVPKGTGSAWDKYGVAAPSVAAVGSYYYMWYTGGGTSLGTLATNILNGNSLDTALNNGNTRLAIGHASTPIPVVSTGVAMGGGGGAVVTPPAAGTTPVTDYVDTSGTFKQMVTARSDDSNCSLTIPAGTNALANGIPLTQITMVQSTSPTSPPANFSAIGLVYTFGPAGTIFSTPVTLTFTYNLSLIPAGLSETSLFIAQFDANVGAWVKLPCSVDTELHTITAQVSGFSDFTILISTRPAAFTTSYLNISPAEANIGETVKISLVVANTGDFSGSYTVNLKINNTIVDSKAVTLTGGASQPVTFTTTRNAAGTYTVTVDSLSGTFTVKATPTPTPTLTPTPTPTPTLTPTPTTTPTPSPTLTPTPSRTPTPTPTPIPGVAAGPNWWLIGGIIAGVIIVVLIVLIIIRRTSE